MSDLAQIGVAGLAVMGRNLARNLARHGHRVAVHNRTYARTEGFMAEYGNEDELEPPRRILIMVKAGAPTKAVIDELVPLLEMGDNTWVMCGAAYEADPDTFRRAARRRSALPTAT
jgi:6-phosphogluconate dehydrogenase